MLYLNRGKLRCQGTMAELLARGLFRDNMSCRQLPTADGTGGPEAAIASPVSVEQQQTDAEGAAGEDVDQDQEAEEVGRLVCIN